MGRTWERIEGKGRVAARSTADGCPEVAELLRPRPRAGVEGGRGEPGENRWGVARSTEVSTEGGDGEVGEVVAPLGGILGRGRKSERMTRLPWR